MQSAGKSIGRAKRVKKVEPGQSAGERVTGAKRGKSATGAKRGKTCDQF